MNTQTYEEFEEEAVEVFMNAKSLCTFVVWSSINCIGLMLLVIPIVGSIMVGIGFIIMTGWIIYNWRMVKLFGWYICRKVKKSYKWIKNKFTRN